MVRPLSCNRAVVHDARSLSEEFDATELRQARASLEMIDLRALKFGPVNYEVRLLRVSE